MTLDSLLLANWQIERRLSVACWQIALSNVLNFPTPSNFRVDFFAVFTHTIEGLINPAKQKSCIRIQIWKTGNYWDVGAWVQELLLAPVNSYAFKLRRGLYQGIHQGSDAMCDNPVEAGWHDGADNVSEDSIWRVEVAEYASSVLHPSKRHVCDLSAALFLGCYLRPAWFDAYWRTLAVCVAIWL